MDRDNRTNEQDRLLDLSLEEKVGKLFFVGIQGTEADGDEILSVVRPGGVCLFARNIKEAEQTRRLTDGIRELLGDNVLISLDQEGGLVDRLRRVVTPMPAASEFRRVEDVRRFAAIVAEIVRILGFNMNFAPVVDVIDEGRRDRQNGLHSRNFGTTADESFIFSNTFLTTLQEHGCIGCIKHFPGLGAAEVDSHEDLPEIAIEEQELESVDLNIYRRFIGSGTAYAVMVAHAVYPNSHLQERDQSGRLLPSSLSPAFVNTLLRDQLGFTGVAVSDDLEMGAITKRYGIGEACVMAVNAGIDMLAICSSPEAVREGYEHVLKAFMDGTLVIKQLDRAVTRISELDRRISTTPDLDLDRLQELSSQISGLRAEI